MVSLEEGVPELLAPEHVDEEVGCGVEAGQEVGRADDSIYHASGLACLQKWILDANQFVNIGHEFDGLTGDEKKGD